MKEASKAKSIRPAGFRERYLGGEVLDIGCGDDLVVPGAVGFDLGQGDANFILNYFKPESFDCVYSSHSLEHMVDPVKCLREWFSLVKRGGFMIVTVPDEDLYEQGIWPSAFNSDHKHTFRLGKSSWSPVSVDLLEETKKINDAEVLYAKQEDFGYLHVRGGGKIAPMWMVRAGIKLKSLIYRLGLSGSFLDRWFLKLSGVINCPIDQTLGNATAQITIILQRGGM